MNETVQKIISDRRNNGSELIFPSPKTGVQGTSVKKACIGAAERAKIGHLTIRDLRRTFGTRLNEMGYPSSVTAKLLGHGDMRSVHRYERAKDILREAVKQLEVQNRPQIVPITQKVKALTRVSA